MTDISQETHIALLERDIQAVKDEQRTISLQVEALIIERDKALKWGIATLGALVLSMGAFIVSFVKDHLK